MSDTDFVIAWKTGDQIHYLAGDDDGVHAADSADEALHFTDYDEGYALFTRWASALCSLDGAVLRFDEIEAQFASDRPAPRRPFYATDEAVAAAQMEAQAEMVRANQQTEYAQQEQRRIQGEADAFSIKAAALDRIAIEHPDIVAAALKSS